MSSKFSVAILGGVGAGKKTLSTKLSHQLTPFQRQKIEIYPSNSSLEGNSTSPDYRIFIDRPFSQLLEKYVISLPLRELIDKENLKKKLKDFRIHHEKNVLADKLTADFLIQGLENEERIHHLTLEILKSWRQSLTATRSSEPPEVQVYLERKVQKAHPGKISGNLHVL